MSEQNDLNPALQPSSAQEQSSTSSRLSAPPMAEWTAHDGKRQWGLCHPEDWWSTVSPGSRKPARRFHPWIFTSSLTLTHCEARTGYSEVDLEKIHSTDDALKVIEHVNTRAWADPATVRLLVTALEHMFDLPQFYFGMAALHPHVQRPMEITPFWRSIGLRLTRPGNRSFQHTC